MKPQLKIYFLSLCLIFLFTTGYSQQEHFRSQQVFSKEQLNKSVSSLTIHDDLILFNANDYYLYAYSKTDGTLKWATETHYKSLTPAFVMDSVVYAGYYADNKQQAAQFRQSDGKFIRTLPFGPLATKPFIRNGILYGTAIYEYGCILAYDLKRDTVAWSRFIAHGYSNQPYYFDNKIMANAEANNWVALGYDGILLETVCKVNADIFVENIPCVEIYSALSHDGIKIKGKLADDIFGKDLMGLPKMITTQKLTFALNETTLTILTKKLKIKQQVDISMLAEELVPNDNTQLLKADDENIWILYSDYLLQYNHKTQKLVKLTDLTTWLPQTVLLDEDKVWLISGKDGLLYGITL